MQYFNDRRLATLFLGGVTVIVDIAFLFDSSGNYWLLIFFLFNLVMLCVWVYMCFGVYITVEDNKISLTKGFFFKKTVDQSLIKEIHFQQTWLTGKNNKSLNIIFQENHIMKDISLPNLGFSENTLAKLASDLKRLNPSIYLMPEVVQLIEKSN